MDARAVMVCWALAAGCAGLAASGPAAEVSPPATGDTAGGGAPHILFMGTDLSVQRGTKFLRVRDVSGSSFLVKAGDEDVYVPMQMRSANLKFDLALKLSRASVKLGRLRGGRTFTPGNDPRIKFNARSGAAAGAAAAVDLANFHLRQAETSRAFAGASPLTPQSTLDELDKKVAEADRAYQDAMAMISSDQNIVGTHANRLQNELADGDFDAMEVEFEISSAVPLENPYIVIISRFREKGTKPGMSRNWVYAKSIDPVGPKPRYLRVREGGFPFGFVLDDFQVHVYNNGEEVATDVSPKRVELSREEAFQYLVLQHIGGNKGATLPPVPALGDLPADLRDRLGAGQFTQPYFVKVSRDGRPLGAYADQACVQRIEEPYLVSLFTGMLFKPALEKGTPVDGVCRVRLGNLRL